MTGLIDYAGLYPPAQLAMKEAAENYLSYSQSPDRWMLGRFVCGAGRLDDLVSVLARHPGAGKVRVASVLQGANTAAGFGAMLGADLDGIARAETASGGHLRVESLEVKLPPDVLVQQEVDAVKEFLVGARGQMRKSGPALRELYFEVPVTRDSGEALATLASAILETGLEEARAHAGDPVQVGFKFRCGGPTSGDAPAEESLAAAIGLCRETGVGFKCTAGLHHPVRRRLEGAGNFMHGFLNVFGAALLAQAHALPAVRIRPILAEEDATAFQFTVAGFSWRDLRVPVADLARLRASATSFGSCSFDEPREDLRTLGWLEPAAVPR